MSNLNRVKKMLAPASLRRQPRGIVRWGKLKVKVIEKIQLYKYVWGNDEMEEGRHRKKQYKGRICKVLLRSKRNSCCVQFIDNDEQIVCSRNALRKV